MNLGLPGASLFSGLRLTIVIRFPSLFINARWWWQGTPNVRVIWSTSCFLFFSFLWLTNLTGSCRGSQWYGFSCFHRKEENKNYRLSFHSSFLLLNAHNVCMLSFLFFFHREGKKKEPFSFYALVSNSIHDSGVYPTIPRPDNFLFRLSSFFFIKQQTQSSADVGGGTRFYSWAHYNNELKKKNQSEWRIQVFGYHDNTCTRIFRFSSPSRNTFFFFAFSLLFFKEGTKKMENRTSFTILFCFQKTSLLLLFSVRYIGRCRVRCLCVLSSGTVTWSHRLFTEKSHLLRTHRQEGEKAGLSRLARPTHGSQGRALLPSVKKKKDDLGRVKKLFFFSWNKRIIRFF